MQYFLNWYIYNVIITQPNLNANQINFIPLSKLQHYKQSLLDMRMFGGGGKFSLVVV